MIVLEPRLYSQRSLWASVSWSWLKNPVSCKVPLFELCPLFEFFSWKKCTERKCIRNSRSLVISKFLACKVFQNLFRRSGFWILPAAGSSAGCGVPSVASEEVFVDLCGMVLTEKENNTVLWKELPFELPYLYYFFHLTVEKSKKIRSSR